MNKEMIYRLWAPEGGRWSAWVKPVLFAHLVEGQEQTSCAPIPTTYGEAIPPADGTTALILDLPDAMGVSLALTAAHLGYQPVLLYNALPGPADASRLGIATLVDMQPIMGAVTQGCVKLLACNVSSDAPPAFVVDARRFQKNPRPTKIFDNRSRVFITNFPSATTLKDAGIRRILLLQERLRGPHPDMIDILAHWQQSGLDTWCVGVAAYSHKPVRLRLRGWLASLQTKLTIWARQAVFMGMDTGSSS